MIGHGTRGQAAAQRHGHEIHRGNPRQDQLRVMAKAKALIEMRFPEHDETRSTLLPKHLQAMTDQSRTDTKALMTGCDRNGAKPEPIGGAVADPHR